MGKDPVWPSARSIIPLMRAVAWDGTCMTLSFPVETMAGPCPACHRARVATSPPLAGFFFVSIPAPSSHLLLDTPTARSSPISSEKSLRPRESVGRNSYCQWESPASPCLLSTEFPSPWHHRCRRRRRVWRLVVLPPSVPPWAPPCALISTTRSNAPASTPACISWLSRAPRSDTRLAGVLVCLVEHNGRKAACVSSTRRSIFSCLLPTPSPELPPQQRRGGSPSRVPRPIRPKNDRRPFEIPNQAWRAARPLLCERLAVIDLSLGAVLGARPRHSTTACLADPRHYLLKGWCLWDACNPSFYFRA